MAEDGIHHARSHHFNIFQAVFLQNSQNPAASSAVDAPKKKRARVVSHLGGCSNRPPCATKKGCLRFFSQTFSAVDAPLYDALCTPKRVKSFAVCCAPRPETCAFAPYCAAKVYKHDPRYNLAASDPEYARLFPVKRGWWSSVCLRSRHGEAAVELMSSLPHDVSPASSSPVRSKKST